MEINEVLEQKRLLQLQIKELNKQLEATRGECVRLGLQSFFNVYPEVTAVRWAQYTPYFNDGDSCTFSSGHGDPELTVSVNGGDEDDDNNWEDTYVSSRKTELNKEELRSKALVDALSIYSDDEMETFFGDHARVVVTRRRINVESYDHD